MTTLERVWSMTLLEAAAHCRAYDLTGKRELSALVEALAAAIDADEERYVRPRRHVVEVSR